MIDGPKLTPFTSINRTMTEINEELQTLFDASDNTINDILTLTAVLSFCEWLCGCGLSLSQGLKLAKFAAHKVEEGVPIEDVEAFLEKKFNDFEKEEKKS